MQKNREKVEAIIHPESDERWYAHFYDRSLGRPEQRVLATGTFLDLFHNDQYIAGRIEHRLPGGYYFKPDNTTEAELTLEDGETVEFYL